jgi:hypothetical protein
MALRQPAAEGGGQLGWRPGRPPALFKCSRSINLNATPYKPLKSPLAKGEAKPGPLEFARVFLNCDTVFAVEVTGGIPGNIDFLKKRNTV